MSIQLIVDGVTVYQSDAAATPPAPTPPPPVYVPPVEPRGSGAGSEVLSSPRNDYKINLPQAQLPFKLAPNLHGEFNSLNHGEFDNVPFIVPPDFRGEMDVSFGPATWNASVPVTIAFSREPDDWQGIHGFAYSTLARPLGMGSVTLTANQGGPMDCGPGLWYLVARRVSPGRGDLMFILQT